MTRSAAFILVHYHGTDLLTRAVEAIRAECASSGLDGDIVVIDNGSSDAQKAVLQSLPVRCLEGGSNAGYAAALNIGIANTVAPYVFLMNPDVFVLRGCTNALIAALDGGAAAAGPKTYWDEQQEFLLPPIERRMAVDELAAAAAERSDRLAAWARRRWREHAHRHWLATEPIRSPCLSGALIAVRRDAAQQVGPFDEGYRLYFEEQDWLARAEAAGLECLYVPGAEIVHLYNQSAVNEPRASAWGAASAARYTAKHLPSWLPRATAAIRPTGSSRLAPPPAVELPLRLDLRAAGRWDDQAEWVEISPLLRGYPAGAARIGSDRMEWSFPNALWGQMASGEYFLTVCSSSGRELRRISFRHRGDNGSTTVVD